MSDPMWERERVWESYREEAYREDVEEALSLTTDLEKDLPPLREKLEQLRESLDILTPVESFQPTLKSLWTKFSELSTHAENLEEVLEQELKSL